MFDRFTERARKVMTLARQEAQGLRNDYIGTEHILLGLVREGSGVAAQVLKNLDVDLRKVREEVERLVEKGEHPVTSHQLPFTPRAKRVLELALEAAQGLGHNYIGTEHLLLGLIRESDGPAAHVLGNLGVRPEAVRREIGRLLEPEKPAGAEARVPSGGPGGGEADACGLERHTEDSRRVLLLARHEALKVNNDCIGTEHILLGLLLEESRVAVRVLESLDVDLASVRAGADRIVEPGTDPVTGSSLPFTPRALRVLELAHEEARGLGHLDIGPGHLLLGLVLEGEGPAATVLRESGVRAEAVRGRIAASGGDKASYPPADAGERRGVGSAEGAFPVSPAARKALMWAVEEAEALGHARLEPGHILLGLLDGCEGEDAALLQELGLRAEEARGRIVTRLRRGGAGPWKVDGGEGAASPP